MGRSNVCKAHYDSHRSRLLRDKVRLRCARGSKGLGIFTSRLGRNTGRFLVGNCRKTLEPFSPTIGMRARSATRKLLIGVPRCGRSVCIIKLAGEFWVVGEEAKYVLILLLLRKEES